MYLSLFVNKQKSTPNIHFTLHQIINLPPMEILWKLKIFRGIFELAIQDDQVYKQLIRKFFLR